MTDVGFLSSSSIHRSTDSRSSLALQAGKIFGCGPCSDVAFNFGADKVGNKDFEKYTIAYYCGVKGFS